MKHRPVDRINLGLQQHLTNVSLTLFTYCQKLNRNMTKDTKDIDSFTTVCLDSPGKNELSLSEPLLPATCKVPNEDVASPLERAGLILRLRILSFVTGSVVSLLSQWVLSQLLWDDSILRKDTAHVLMFSVVWAFWTCLVVFSAMILFVQAVYQYYGASSTQAVWDDAVFHMEAHHIVGSLLSISATWIVMDILQIEMPTSPVVPSLLILALGLLTYSVIFRCLAAPNRRIEQADKTDGSASLMPTYQILAATLGLSIGLCSQFLLSVLLWRDRMTMPVIHNMYAFSLTWSFATAIVTYGGCLSLRSLVTEEADRLTAERIFLRMEAHYVFCSLIGICLAWILMDLLMGVQEQILPSIFVLSMSLLAFQAIIYCFPEDKCLEDMELLLKEEDQEEEEEQVKEIAIV